METRQPPCACPEQYARLSYRAWEVLTAGALRPWPPRAASSSEPQVRTSRARYHTLASNMAEIDGQMAADIMREVKRIGGDTKTAFDEFEKQLGELRTADAEGKKY